MYANIDKLIYSGHTIAFEPRPEIDRWLLPALNRPVQGIEATYGCDEAIRHLTPEQIRQLKANGTLALTLSDETIICIERI
jgi:hypothetical protein